MTLQTGVLSVLHRHVTLLGMHQTDTRTDKQKGRLTDTDRLTDADSQADTETGRHRDRQTSNQSDTQVQTHRAR